MIVLDEKFIAQWYFQPQPEMDFMGALMATQEPVIMDQKQDLTFEYRFRYYRDKVAFNSEDEKHWYGMTIHNQTPQYALDKLREMVKVVSLGNKVTEILMDEKGVMGVFERMQKLPMFHMQEVKEGTA